MAHKRVKLNAVVGLYPANAVGDDIEVYEDESRTTVKVKMYGLRQQVGGAWGAGLGDVSGPRYIRTKDHPRLYLRRSHDRRSHDVPV